MMSKGRIFSGMRPTGRLYWTFKRLGKLGFTSKGL